MKKIINFPKAFALAAAVAMFASCGDDELIDSEPIDTSNPSYNVIVNATNASSDERHIEIEAEPGSTVNVTLLFTSDKEGDDKKMRRVYGTEYYYGATEVSEYVFPATFDTKGDGSIDIESADGFEFTTTLAFTAPALDETIQYSFWTTNNRGDFRDISNSNAILDDAYGSITLKGAEATITNSVVMNEFSARILEAPLGDASSKTFISLFDGNTYKISEGEEFAAFWDFGYLYGTNSGAGLYSANDYPSAFNGGTSVTEFLGIDGIVLNNFYFSETTLSSTDFDAITEASELDYITASTSERVRGLSVGDVVEFVDQYGNKGLIKVTAIVTGNGSDGEITFDVKVQVNATPVLN